MIENEIISLIKNADRIAILPHVSADGDAMGSSLALALALKKLNKNQ
ncbi:3'-to-5' oligoribonuclease A [Acetivibrio straminisolvens JCM 21531]|uniref:3'-to-5' oligoribonuclease A n=1 Tax=Acetivibrio straminisolvens JCM 21531 TaxID=1294263 RepID=W4V454_9FIRM|nr:3'-to-5' oligoribonuclease A [Acetivibrio straminisolvens JCM 21531]